MMPPVFEADERISLWMVLSYDGSRFQGWQKQPHHDTVQDQLELALGRVVRQPRLRTYGCGRTDRDVHADVYVANAWLDGPLASLAQRGTNFWLFNLRKHLPNGIRIHSVSYRDSTYHARFSARRRRYTMRVLWGMEVPLAEEAYTTPLPSAPDPARFVQALRCFLGRHDYRGLTVEDEGETQIFAMEYRSMNHSLGEEVGAAEIRITGDRFLRRQVRGMIGATAAVAAGRAEVSDLRHTLRTGERHHTFRTARPQGLRLSGVCYDFGWIYPPTEHTYDPWRSAVWQNVAK